MCHVAKLIIIGLATRCKILRTICRHKSYYAHDYTLDKNLIIMTTYIIWWFKGSFEVNHINVPMINLVA